MKEEPKEETIMNYPMSDEDIVCGQNGCRGYVKDKDGNYKRV